MRCKINCTCLRHRPKSTEFKELVSKVFTKDIVGQQFGRLTVITKTDKRTSGGGILWECLCNCGNKSYVRGTALKSGRISSCGCLRTELRKRRGPNHPNYNHNLTDQDRAGRQDIQYQEWVLAVKTRDKFRCMKCSQLGKKLIAHHIESFHNNKELRINLNNGITFCKSCHNRFHKTYGYGNNTKEQLMLFLSD